MLVTKLEMPDIRSIVDVKDGTFTFVTKEGQDAMAEFYVRTCADDPKDARVMSKRQDDLNQQFTDAWESLRLAGNQRIQFKTLYPDPFF
jgi:uncharacterized protein (DUF2336 family)